MVSALPARMEPTGAPSPLEKHTDVESVSFDQEDTGTPAATARRCLLTLEELGYVTRSGRSFFLRPKVLELGAAYLEAMEAPAVRSRSSARATPFWAGPAAGWASGPSASMSR